MNEDIRLANLVLGGGGVRGIAYIGMYEVAEEKSLYFKNIAGVSVGALVGAFIGAGYNSVELRRILYDFDFEKIKLRDISREIPAVKKYMEYTSRNTFQRDKSFKTFLNMRWAESDNNSAKNYRFFETDEEFTGYRRDLLKNIVTYSKQGSLFDGDYLEEWVYKILRKRGIKTFADLRLGKPDWSNPNGYKVRMTAVDANRGRIVVLPDDISYYGIDPDRLEVAKAVRMSTSVPFAFKPVEVLKKDGSSIKKHYLIDGGVLDNLPIWLIQPSMSIPLIACELKGKEKLINVMTPFNILKGLISTVHDFGVPDIKHYKNSYLVRIYTGDISFLDFELSDKEKKYLIDAGRLAALYTFQRVFRPKYMQRCGLFCVLRRILGLHS
ncbi:patatin-like phospholipase family protein [Acetivibrio straminisolvens]|jgi:NTE family protein|uniref:Lysophospholipase-like family protein n=1 Tax=Acetivibrio straminisolvens JCM 21531 TaxID=1294263 RepID=W4V1W3_9FIRM|nr:patatin-like phospholipase family protein [Acetivibrio straminisolvens]GAE87102.1 lysophospholipase-like family protein [Acetivibrio straminisolvens JCM 21531]